MASAGTWQLEGPSASLTCGPFTARLALGEPGSGLIQPSWQGRSCPTFEVLRFGFPADSQLVESYSRGGDLVAAYSQSAASAIAPHIYWRAAFHEKVRAAQVELVVSVQTSLLDSQPGSVVSSLANEVRLFHAPRLAADAFAEWSTNQCFEDVGSASHLVVLRHETLSVSYAEMVHPSDLEALQLVFQDDGRSGTRAVLFRKPHLEKGVIRRARIGGWFLPTENDLAVAVDLARQFLAEPLPLTA